MLPGLVQYLQLHIPDQRVVGIDELDIHRNAFSHHRIGEGLRDPQAVAPVGDLLSECLAVVLGVGVLDMGQKLGSVDAPGTSDGAAGPGWSACPGGRCRPWVASLRAEARAIFWESIFTKGIPSLLHSSAIQYHCEDDVGPVRGDGF